MNDFIMIETMTGNRYPINTHGKDPQSAVCKATRDLKVSCRMVPKGEENDKVR